MNRLRGLIALLALTVGLVVTARAATLPHAPAPAAPSVITHYHQPAHIPPMPPVVPAVPYLATGTGILV